ncbi:MAG TPA: ABC transporter ATP-binding protein [Bryobacteraceae bacterium]|nr:ABC transporter ATP-binding protein [Bryobacteraceae bacterium]
MSILRLEGLSCAYGSTPVLRSVTAAVEHPELVALIGPNGAGKSTLINVISGRMPEYQGSCLLHDVDIRRMSRRQLCLQAAHVPQQRIDDIPFSVEEVVLTGRTPHGRGLYESGEDLAALETALDLTRLGPLRKRRFSSLSGGEQQRVLVAAAVAQASPILLLDEPGAHLDPENQTELWDLLAMLRDQGRLIVIVTHHLHLATRRSDRVWVLNEGRLMADASPGGALGPEQLEAVFHVPFHRYTNEQGRVFLNYG